MRSSPCHSSERTLSGVNTGLPLLLPPSLPATDGTKPPWLACAPAVTTAYVGAPVLRRSIPSACVAPRKKVAGTDMSGQRRHGTSDQGIVAESLFHPHRDAICIRGLGLNVDRSVDRDGVRGRGVLGARCLRTARSAHVGAYHLLRDHGPALRFAFCVGRPF